MEKLQEKTVLVALDTGENRHFDAHVNELKELAKACDFIICETIVQHAPAANKATYVGTGKVEEILHSVRWNGADLVIFDNSLSPIQLRNLKDILDVPVMDRNTLILEIFSRRAGTKEAKLQVEVASLQYALPRLVGLHDALSRQGGASGAMSNKGSGEKKLELDRRHIENRIAFLRRELEQVAQTRQTQRKSRQKNGVPLVSLVGYTNAGKSSIMNGLLSMFGKADDKKVFEENMLFATLETSIREIIPEKGKNFLLSDTVGFVEDLPHHLVRAFHSTLEEAAQATVLIHVVDVNEPFIQEHINVTLQTLKDLEAGSIPTITVFNKMDISGNPDYPKRAGDVVYISAKEEKSLKLLTEVICEKLFGSRKKCDLFIPYDKGHVLSAIQNKGQVLETEYEAEGTRIVALIDDELMGRYRQFITNIY